MRRIKGANPCGPFSMSRLRTSREPETHRPPGFARLCVRHGSLVVLTVVNTSVTDTLERTIQIRGANILSASGRILTAPDIHAHNSFADPRQVETKPAAVSVKQQGVVHRFRHQ